MTILGEQQIRDKFNEQSLNGVDHYFELKSFDQHYLFLIQEKWKLVTNQREVSQFLDCCARIKARMPEFHGKLFRLWVTRTEPSENGAKSLEEGAAYVLQSTTSMTMLAQNAGLFICELLHKREASQDMSLKMPSYFMSDTPFMPDTPFFFRLPIFSHLHTSYSYLMLQFVMPLLRFTHLRDSQTTIYYHPL